MQHRYHNPRPGAQSKMKRFIMPALILLTKFLTLSLCFAITIPTFLSFPHRFDFHPEWYEDLLHYAALGMLPAAALLTYYFRNEKWFRLRYVISAGILYIAAAYNAEDYLPMPPYVITFTCSHNNETHTIHDVGAAISYPNASNCTVNPY